jgi:hypothetical protein
MRVFYSIIIVVCLLFSAGCGSTAKKKDVTIKGARADSGITVKDEGFKFEGIKKVILYNEIDDEDSNAILFGIAAALQSKGIEAVIDTGESMTYDGESFRVRTYKNLMSVYFNLVVLKSGGKKGNEEIIADIKADSIPKLVEITVGFIFKN